MSFWIIILLIAILLGGGYGIYSFRNKNKKTPEMIKPIVHHETPIVKTEVKQQEIPLNTVPPTTQANSHTPQSNIAK
jgi:flagellar basal body-associated protein FliL